MRKINFGCTLSILLFITPLLVNAQVDVNDSLALVDFYNSTDGPNWPNQKNWLTSYPVSKWEGVTVTNKRVTGLINTGGLRGKLPASIGNLTELTDLSLSYSYGLHGSIPHEIGNCTKLNNLIFYETGLNGYLPHEMGNLVNLSVLLLGYNYIKGKIPNTFSNLINLEQLVIFGTNISGSIPKFFKRYKNLTILELVLNNLSGSIPEELGEIKSLQTLYLSYNQLTGVIPESLNNLKNLENLLLSNNQLTGEIPFQLENLQKLISLELQYNQLSGEIPYQLGNLKKLKYLLLDHNKLSGKIPYQLSKLEKLSDLYLSYNQLTGKIPNSLGKLSNLSFLYLNNNKLSGSIPDSLSKLSSLLSLYLNNNHLTGPIPESITQLTRVREFNFSHNYLTAPLPLFLIKKMHQIEILDISHNSFTFEGLDTVKHSLGKKFIYLDQHKVPLFQNGNKIWVSVGGKPTKITYKWYKDGILYSTIKMDSTLIINESGKYKVVIRNSDLQDLVLQSDTINYVASENFIASNIKSEKKTFASVFPNPVKTNTTLSFYASGNYTINIVDINGKTIQTITGVSNKKQNVVSINLSHYSSGVYNAVITDEKNEKRVLKILKE